MTLLLGSHHEMKRRLGMLSILERRQMPSDYYNIPVSTVCRGPSDMQRWYRWKQNVSIIHQGVEYPHSFRRLFFSTQTNEGQWISRVKQILDCPVGTLGESIGWQNVEMTIQETQRGKDNAETLYALLNRIVQELDRPVEGTTTMTGQDLYPLLNTTVYRWRDHYVKAEDKSSVFIEPSELVRKIRAWGKQCNLKGTTSIYTMILEAATSNTADHVHGIQFADTLLEWMIDEAQRRQHFGVQPSIYSVSAVLKGWVASGNPNACQRIEGWIERIRELHNDGWLDLKPNTVVYNIFLHALAEANKTERAEQVLQGLLEGSWDGVEPDPISFSTVLLAYTKQETMEAMGKAETLLNQMQELYFAGMDTAKPNLVAFTTVIHGFALIGQPEPAEPLLNRLSELYSATLDPDFEPDITVYNSVMMAWSNAGQPDRAEEFLRKMLDHGTVEPNDKSYHAVLNGWAKAGRPDEAEALLYFMHQLCIDHVQACPPTTRSYNIALDAWARSKRPQAWQRALELLQHMEDLYDNGHEELRPSVLTWNSVLNCFRYAGKGDFHQAFKVLDRFRAAHALGRVDEGPNLTTWNTLLAGCVHNTKDEYRVQQILQSMAKDNCKPDIITYNTIFSCCAGYEPSKERTKWLTGIVKRMHTDKCIPSRVTHLRLVEAWIALGRVDIAESVLRELCHRAVLLGDASIIDRDPFHKVFQALSGQKKVHQIESTILLMHGLHDKHGFDAVKPSLQTYNILLHAWATSGRLQSGERAEFLLRQMSERGVDPTRVSYNIVLNAWAESGDLVACSKIECLVLEMILSGKQDRSPDETSYNTWMKAIRKDPDERNKSRRANELLDTMRIHNFEPGDSFRQELSRIVEGNAKVVGV